MPMGRNVFFRMNYLGNRKLPFDMDFQNIEKFFRNFNVSCSHQRANVTENRDFSWKSTAFCWNVFIFN